MDKKLVVELAKEKLAKLRGEFPELVREAGEGVCAKLTPIFYKAKAGILGRFNPEKKVEFPQEAVVVKDVEENTEDSRAKVKFTKGKIKRSGVYLFKEDVQDPAFTSATTDYRIYTVKHEKGGKKWLISDFPYANCTERFENDGTDEWARLE